MAPKQPPATVPKRPATGKGVVPRPPNAVANGGQHIPKTGKDS